MGLTENNELDALLYDCKHIGNVAKEIELKMRDLACLAKKQWIDNIRRQYPNVEDPEQFHWKYNVGSRINDLQSCFDELQNDLACMGRNVKLESAHDWIKGIWEGDRFNVKD